jgi:hypothetical protein
MRAVAPLSVGKHEVGRQLFLPATTEAIATSPGTTH